MIKRTVPKPRATSRCFCTGWVKKKRFLWKTICSNRYWTSPKPLHTLQGYSKTMWEMGLEQREDKWFQIERRVWSTAGIEAETTSMWEHLPHLKLEWWGGRAPIKTAGTHPMCCCHYRTWKSERHSLGGGPVLPGNSPPRSVQNMQAACLGPLCTPTADGTTFRSPCTLLLSPQVGRNSYSRMYAQQVTDCNSICQSSNS